MVGLVTAVGVLLLVTRVAYDAFTSNDAAEAARTYDRALRAMEEFLGDLGPDSTFHQRIRAYSELDGVRYVEQWATFDAEGLLVDIGILVTDEEGISISELVRDGNEVSVRYLDTGITLRLATIGETSADDLRSRLAEAFEQQIGRVTGPGANARAEHSPDEVLLETIEEAGELGDASQGAPPPPRLPRMKSVSHIDPTTYITRMWERYQETSEGWKLVESRENLVFEIVPRSQFSAPTSAQ